MNFATATIQPAADSVEFDCNPTQAGQGQVWRGKARQGRQGTARIGWAGHGMAGEAGLGPAWRCVARQARRGTARQGMERRGMAGGAWPGTARLGAARQGRHSTNRSDRAGYKWIANNKQK